MPKETLPLEQPPATLQRTAGPFVAICLVIANVIGAGIYTTPGFLARDLGSPFAVLSIWIIGAILALAGALSYSELGAAYPEAGGEYIYFREAFGPLWGYLSGWTSFFAGFSAPVAAASIGFAAYLSHFAPQVGPGRVLGTIPLGGWALQITAGQIVALAAVWALSFAHITGMRRGGQLQILLTVAKVASIAALIVLGLWLGNGSWNNFQSGPEGLVPPGAMRNGAISLIFVLFSYSGWNAAAYIAGEVRQPHRTLPVSLLTGTAIVTVLYLGLNTLFLYGLGISGMSGVLQVGEKAALAMFGPVAGDLVAAMMALSILASASAMIVAGPRVYFAMALDGLFPKRVAAIHPRYGSPAVAIVCQGVWSSVLILSGTFEALIVYSGFVLVFFSALAVAALLVLRVRRPELPRPFRVPLYPWTPLLFIGFSVWILLYTVWGRPIEASLGVLTVLLGLPLYFYWTRKAR
ncbi:MAG: amino acid permease [Acidobacteria bacterium]|nr:amino acid permease [Acidobacteriota bacterium]